MSMRGRPKCEMVPLGGKAHGAKGVVMSTYGRPKCELVPLGGKAHGAKGVVV
jgi:hypothetical protein